MSQIASTALAHAPKSSDFVDVAEFDRAGMVESRHRGIGALTAPDGSLLAELGSSQKLIYPRSAVKPIQAVAMRRAGLKLYGAELAICCGSHQARLPTSNS